MCPWHGVHIRQRFYFFINWFVQFKISWSEQLQILSLSKAIHSVLHKLLHRYYVVFWSFCERVNSAFLLLWNRARGELFWEPAGICLSWSILYDMKFVWLVCGVWLHTLEVATTITCGSFCNKCLQTFCSTTAVLRVQIWFLSNISLISYKSIGKTIKN